MLHVSCDVCGKDVGTGEEHHIVSIEVYAARPCQELTEEDLDEDHLEAVAQLLRDAEENDTAIEVEPAVRKLRYDLCAGCRKRYLRDPLGREHAHKFSFSPN